MSGPLAGIKVIEVGQALAGPVAGAILADMGADVIKIEKPDGGDDARGWGPPFIDESSIMFHVTNRNKRSVTLDMKNAADVEKLKSLVRDADILIQNLRSGVVSELGVGPDDISRKPQKGSIWLAELAPGRPLLPVLMSVEARHVGHVNVYLTALGGG